MLNRRFMPYIVMAGLIALFSVCYVGYRAYQNHIAFEGFISDAETFYHSLDDGHAHSVRKRAKADTSEIGGKLPKRPSGRDDLGHIYEVGGIPLETNMPKTSRDLELEEWIITGKMTPYVEQELKRIATFQPFAGQVRQRVVSPDGKLHEVLVPEGLQYEEGDVISKSEFLTPAFYEDHETPQPGEGALYILGEVEYPLPDDYYAIEDKYLREEYFEKFAWSIKNGVSMEEVEKKVATGELDFSLSKEQKRLVDEHEAMKQRMQMLDMGGAPPVFDKPPVKVQFLPDNAVGAPPGWMRKQDGSLPSAMGEVIYDRNDSGADTIDDATAAQVQSDMPISPSDLSSVVELSRRDELGAEPPQPSAPPSVEQIEARLKQRLSPQQFGNAQQLIDQYGTEEGLRRLREMDPEAARQFEQKRRPVPSRDVPDGGQSKTGSKD